MKKLASDRPLKIAFLIGGIYDILLGISLLLFIDLLAELLDAAKPEPRIFAQLVGLFLIAMGYFLLYAAQNPRRLAFVGAASALIRLLYALLVIMAWITQDIETIYLITALTDVITGLMLLGALLLTDDVSLKQLWKY
ncbi:MAG: hypothetical protein ACE5OZ_19905 [Candidatus Heimdallarchaeota archaeon]